ncbi:hypothetical protein M1513_00505 [Patescibacteria group bacterium]|nr:hypothetical protein [Patescibacteria group bacterium]
MLLSKHRHNNKNGRGIRRDELFASKQINDGALIGKLNEAKVRRAAEIFRERRPDLISYYHCSTRDGEMDGAGIDIIIFLKNPFFLALPIQVKSSTRALKKHYKKYPYILGIAIRPRQTPEVISYNLEKAVIHFLKNASRLITEIEIRKQKITPSLF